MAAKHWIAMGGTHGCLPDNCCAVDTLGGAVDTLTGIYELSRRQRTELRQTGSVELKQDQDGEYCEVSECDCGDSSVHNND